MSIKYGTIFLNNYTSGGQLILTPLYNELGKNFSLLHLADYLYYKFDNTIGFPNQHYGITLQGFPNPSEAGLNGKGYFFLNLQKVPLNKCVIVGSSDNETLSSSIAANWTDRYSLHGRNGDVKHVGVGDNGNSQKYVHARYAINDNGDWILSFTINENYNNNRYNQAGGSAYYIGTKLEGKDIIIDQSGTVWDNTALNTKTGYYRLSRINPVYYDGKQTSQIALTDFLIRDNAYDIKTLDNIKLAITYRGGLNPYLIKDEKGDEYCIIPASCPNESALVLRDTKE